MSAVYAYINLLVSHCRGVGVGAGAGAVGGGGGGGVVGVDWSKLKIIPAIAWQ